MSALGYEAARGLSDADARDRIAETGYNEIAEEHSNPLRGVLKRLWGPIPWMLEAALALELLLGKVAEPGMIAAWLMFSAIVGGVQEQRAHRALDLLRSSLRVSARVRRQGTWRSIPARELVPGDVIRVCPGDLVPADCTIERGTVDLDQSELTGESELVSRTIGEPIYSASTVRRGEATAVVTATGASSYFGRTAELVRSARSTGHLDQLLFAVVRYLVAIDAVLAGILVVFALRSGADLLELIPFLLVLIIATVPVTMPAAFTVANAVEARMLARQGVLVTGLSAVQEAATMDVLCVDKTGTLTENRQTLVAVIPLAEDGEDAVLAWAAAACEDSVRSPLDAAVLLALKQRGVAASERLSFTPFDPMLKRSEARVRQGDATMRVVLGAPLAVQELAQPLAGLMSRVQSWAASGTRLLAVAAGATDILTIRGLVALADTPRKDAAALIKALQDLGIRILMVSGDTLATARAISHQVGLGDRFGDAAASRTEPLRYDGFAQCYPQDKYQLVRKLQSMGRITGMTGDGVNDAPALKQAEIGIAVSTASDVAKASAQVVLTREGLEDMIAVVHSGRRVYRRMLTWTITKIARTVELAALLAIGYVFTGFFVTSLLLIAVLVILNDVVTITLATDRAWISPVPERWNVRELSKTAGIFAAGWLILAFGILGVAIRWLDLPVPQIQTLMFVYLIYTAQTTIYLTRVPGRFWSFAPSPCVALATLGNVLIAGLIGYLGILTAPVSASLLGAMLATVLVATVVLDQIKLWLFGRAEVFAGRA